MAEIGRHLLEAKTPPPRNIVEKVRKSRPSPKPSTTATIPMREPKKDQLTEIGSKIQAETPLQVAGTQSYANYVSAKPVELQDGTYSHRTPRTFGVYCQEFNYGPDGERLKGKVILDMGTGDSDFAHESRKRNLARVVSVDADYGKNPPKDTTDSVAAFVQGYLPFRDGSFDEVVSSYLFQWLKEEDIPKVLAEMLRVTRNYGMIKIYPARANSPNIALPNYIALAQHVQNGSLTLEIKKDPTLPESVWESTFEQVRQEVGFYMEE